MRIKTISVRSFSCPRCKSRIRWWPNSIKQWFSISRECPICGAYLVFPITAGAIYGVIIGLMGGGLYIALQKCGIDNNWFRLIIILPFLALLSPILARILTGWLVVRNDLKNSIKVVKWKRVGLAFLIALVVACKFRTFLSYIVAAIIVFTAIIYALRSKARVINKYGSGEEVCKEPEPDSCANKK